MINLLPADHAVKLRLGRQNARLSRWLVGVLAAIVGLLIIIGAGSLYLNHQADNYQKGIAATKQQLQAQNLTKVQNDANEISSDVKVINQILGKEVRFSDLLQAIGNIMPPGSVLSSLSLSQVSGSINLDASAKNYASIVQVAVNLNDPANNLFSKVDIVNINCSYKQKTAYPCQVTLRALFSKDAQTKFLNVSKGAAS